MNDIQLLNYAAKAAGWSVLGETSNLVCSREERFKGGLCIRTGEKFDSFWNPFKDDGDAFRLAVKLDLFWKNKELFDVQLGELLTTNENVRQAIVRAAAEIGKNLE